MARKRTKEIKEEENQMSENLESPEVQEAPEVNEVPTEINGVVNETEGKREKKLSKDLASLPGKVVITVVGGQRGAMVFDVNSLPGTYPTAENPVGDGVKGNLPCFAIGHKLGDAASGKSGVEAEEAIVKVWEGLLANDWTVRAPAAPKVSLKEVASNYENLTEEQKSQAAELMAKLGIKLPGITS